MNLRNKTLNIFRFIDDIIYEHALSTKVLFVASDGYGFSCQAPVIQALKDQKNIIIHTTFDSPKKMDLISFNGDVEEALFQDLFLDPTKASFSKWHLIVDTHVNGFYPKRNALRIYMHHGPGFGIQGSKMAIVNNHDIFFGLSNYEREIFEKRDPGVFLNEKAFFPVGFPKDDDILKGAFARKGVLKDLGLEDKPTILITSHWQDISILRTFGAEIFRILSDSMPECNVIQTGHPWLWQPGKKIESEWCNSLLENCRNIEKRYKNARFVPSGPVEPLLSMADLLVGDHSSVMTTYSLLDRPIVFYDSPDLEFAIKEIYEIYLAASYPFLELNQLVDNCRKAIACPDEKKEGRKKMRNAFHSNPGDAGEAAADILRRIGPVCSTKSKKWKRVKAMSVRPTDPFVG